MGGRIDSYDKFIEDLADDWLGQEETLNGLSKMTLIRYLKEICFKSARWISNSNGSIALPCLSLGLFVVCNSTCFGQNEPRQVVDLVRKTECKDLHRCPKFPFDAAELAELGIDQTPPKNARKYIELLTQKIMQCEDLKTKAGYHLKKAVVLYLLDPTNHQVIKPDLTSAEQLSRSPEIYSWSAFVEEDADPVEFKRYLGYGIGGRSL